MDIVATERNVCYAKHENEINVTLNGMFEPSIF